MENRDRNILYGYILIEFGLFIVSYVMRINMGINMNYHILSSIGFVLNIVFLILYRPRIDSDKYYGIIYSSIVLIAEVFSMLSLDLIANSAFILSFGAFSIRIGGELEQKKTIPYIVSSIIVLSSIILSLIGIMESRYFLFIAVALLSIESIIIMTIRYNNGNVLHKPNWFFGIMGSIIYAIYLACSAFGPIMDDTALMKQMVVMGSTVLLIPSILMLSISFIFFQQREA